MSGPGLKPVRDSSILRHILESLAESINQFPPYGRPLCSDSRCRNRFGVWSGREPGEIHRPRRSTLCLHASTRTGIGPSSSRPMRRFRQNTCCWKHFLADRADQDRHRDRAQDRQIPEVDQGDHGGWSLYHRWRLQHFGQREGLFHLPQDLRRGRHRRPIPTRSLPHAKAILAAWREPRPANVFTLVQLALFGQVPVARGAGDADRAHQHAALVPGASRQGQLLVAHRNHARSWC